MRKLLFAILLLPTSSFAVDYSLPTDGWYQLQDRTSTICQTGDAMPCNVDPGIYILINHTTGARNENFEITDSPSSTDEVKIIYQPAVHILSVGTEPQSRSIPCPENTVAINASCTNYSLHDNLTLIEGETGIRGNSSFCAIYDGHVTLQATAICAVGTIISILPVIDMSE